MSVPTSECTEREAEIRARFTDFGSYVGDHRRDVLELFGALDAARTALRFCRAFGKSREIERDVARAERDVARAERDVLVEAVRKATDGATCIDEHEYDERGFCPVCILLDALPPEGRG